MIRLTNFLLKVQADPNRIGKVMFMHQTPKTEIFTSVQIERWKKDCEELLLCPHKTTVTIGFM